MIKITCCTIIKADSNNGLSVVGNSYNSEERVVCAGYDNGDIKMFDLKTMSLRWETNVNNGVSLSIWLQIDRL